jgi:hypothetical protein
MSDRDDSRNEAENDLQEDLELRDEDGEVVIGGVTPAGSLDAGIHFKYDLKAQKEG